MKLIANNRWASWWLLGIAAASLASLPCRAMAQAAGAAPAASAAPTASTAPYGSGAAGTNPNVPSATGPTAPQTDFGATLYSVSPTAEIGNGTVAAQNYALGPGDMINVYVAPQGKYSASSMLVTQDGFIDYPVLGRIPANGKTAEELSGDIAAKLKEWCINPDVTVNVVALHPQVVYVTGNVMSMRTLDIHAAPTLLKALTLAGGVPDRDTLSHLVIARGHQLIQADLYPLWVQGIDNGQNYDLQPGDTIIVPTNTARVTVVGAVATPGIQPLQMPSDSPTSHERLADALSRAGSTDKNHGARIGQVAILRHVTPDGKADITKYDFGKYLKTGDLTQNPLLQDNDLIIVPEENHPVTPGSILNFVPFYYLFAGHL